MKSRHLWALAACIGLLAAGPAAQAAGAPPMAPDVAAAKELIDTVYNKPERLRQARTLLKGAFDGSSRDPQAYVQAARVHIKTADFSTPEASKAATRDYHAMLDKALALAPDLAKAHVLKANAYGLENNHAQQLKSLLKAKELDKTDPWLWIEFAQHARAENNRPLELGCYVHAVYARPIRSSEDRAAYVFALYQLAVAGAVVEGLDMKKMGTLAWRERHPDDVWVLGNFASVYLYNNMFDDAIVFAREALKGMDYGMARGALAAGLYGKAAVLIDAGNAAGAAPYVAEAGRSGYTMGQLQSYYFASDETTARLMPILRRIIPR
jgi:tetratricopeptide (TPR) repeat protein